MFLLSSGRFISLIGSAFRFSFCGQIVGMVVMVMVAAVRVCIFVECLLTCMVVRGAFLGKLCCAFLTVILGVFTLYSEHLFVLFMSVGVGRFNCVLSIQSLMISPSRFRIDTTLILPMAFKITINLSSMKTRAILRTLFILFVMILQLRLEP